MLMLAQTLAASSIKRKLLQQGSFATARDSSDELFHPEITVCRLYIIA